MASKPTVLKNYNNQYESQMKNRFIALAKRPDLRYSDLLDYIDGEIKQSKKMSRLNYRIRCFKNDGIYQLNKAINQEFGAVVSQGEKQMSGGEQAIETVDIELADGTRTKAPYGEIRLDALGEDSNIYINYDEDAHELTVTGQCQFRFSSLMDDIINTTKNFLATESIYKAQALEITNINEPKIINLDNIDNQLMVLSEDTEYDIQPIVTRIKYADRCTERGIPLKYGALMEGPYGTGKTLLAFKIAKMAIENGWVFIYLKDPKLLAETLRMSKIIDRSGHGAVVFVEDVDQVVRGTRDSAMQDILNTLDGGDTKDMNVITLFTTNHIELIEPTFLRGKRIGTIISLGALDAKTADDFIRRSFEIGHYTVVEDLDEVCRLVESANIVPAFMAEIVETVKARLVEDDRSEVTSQDLIRAVEKYKRQVELSKTKDMSETPEQRVISGIKEIFGSGTTNQLNTILKYWNRHYTSDKALVNAVIEK